MGWGSIIFLPPLRDEFNGLAMLFIGCIILITSIVIDVYKNNTVSSWVVKLLQTKYCTFTVINISILILPYAVSGGLLQQYEGVFIFFGVLLSILSQYVLCFAYSADVIDSERKISSVDTKEYMSIISDIKKNIALIEKEFNNFENQHQSTNNIKWTVGVAVALIALTSVYIAADKLNNHQR
ncbi:hypothetical protein Q4R69_18070 [Morganella morganii subsp. sibonii]